MEKVLESLMLLFSLEAPAEQRQEGVPSLAGISAISSPPSQACKIHFALKKCGAYREQSCGGKHGEGPKDKVRG